MNTQEKNGLIQLHTIKARSKLGAYVWSRAAFSNVLWGLANWLIGYYLICGPILFFGSCARCALGVQGSLQQHKSLDAIVHIWAVATSAQRFVWHVCQWLLLVTWVICLHGQERGGLRVFWGREGVCKGRGGIKGMDHGRKHAPIHHCSVYLTIFSP